MKKLISTLLCAAMMLSLAACGGSAAKETPSDPVPSPVESTDPAVDTNPVESPSVPPETEDTPGSIIRAENLFDEDDEEYAIIKSLQGKFQYIDNGGSDITFVADDTWYVFDWGTLTPVAELPAGAEWFQFFDNMEIGTNLICRTDGKIACYDGYGEIRYSDIDFDPETDTLLDTSLGGYVLVMTKTDDGYMMKYYESSDGSGKAPLAYHSEAMLSAIYLSNGENIIDRVAEITVLNDTSYGFDLFCITEDHDAYQMQDAHTKSLDLATSRPFASGVSRIFAHAVAPNMTMPVYGKLDDETAVYSGAPGESITSRDDDFEISFPMPDGHTVNEIKEISACGYGVMFLFDNGDVYLTGKIQKTDVTVYELTKIEELSQLCAAGQIVDITSTSSVFNEYIYLLTNTNELYAYEIRN